MGVNKKEVTIYLVFPILSVLIALYLWNTVISKQIK